MLVLESGNDDVERELLLFWAATAFLVIDTCKTRWIGYYAAAAVSRASCCAANLDTDLP